MNKINKFKNYTIILFLIFLGCLSTFIELINHKDFDFESNTEEIIFPYIDSACKWSLENLQEWFEEFNNEDMQIIQLPFIHPSNIKCQGRPVIITYTLKLQSKELRKFYQLSRC